MEKKKHHYISQAYLRSFCNDDGKVIVYSKDQLGRSWQSIPESIAYENYYYSQPLPDGGQDNNRLEDFFSTIESAWTPLVQKITHTEQEDGSLGKLLEFALMHRVRVPTARNAAEKMRVEQVRMQYRALDEAGEFPPLPSGLDREWLDEHLVIAIDPHQSIHAMPHMLRAIEKIFHAVGFEILENKTDVDFITNDNPLFYFDPTISETEVQPYRIDRNRMDVELMFPVTPRFLLWGHSALKPLAKNTYYRFLRDRDFVQRCNRYASRFADRFVFSRTSDFTGLVKRYSAFSPVIEVIHLNLRGGRALSMRSVFAKREKKPKWNKNVN